MKDDRYFVIHNKARTAAFATPLLDSRESGNRWRRVRADVTIPEGASVSWRVYAAERPFEIGGETVSFAIENADDFLLPNLRGRYLRLAAEGLGGAEVRWVQVFASWESLLDYLPEIYRGYGGFLDRFTALFAAQFFAMERRVDDLQYTLDPAIAPPGTLAALAGRVGVRHAELWPEGGLRKLLTSCVYARMGQFSVFEEYVEYFLGHRPYIIEHFRMVTGVAEHDGLYQEGDLTIFLPPEAGDEALNIDALRVIIDDFLPEGLGYAIRLLDRSPVVSGYNYLGVNSRVGEHERTVIGKSRVGFSVV